MEENIFWTLCKHNIHPWVIILSHYIAYFTLRSCSMLRTNFVIHLENKDGKGNMISAPQLGKSIQLRNCLTLPEF